MNHELFRERFEEMGFDVSVDYQPPDEDELPVLVAENTAGERVYWCFDRNENWCFHFDVDNFSIDGNEFSPHEVDFEGGAVVVRDVSGTRSKEFGYGVAGFRGDLRLDSVSRATVTETH